MVIPNEGGLLLAGLFVRVRVPVSKPYAALTVTERALGLDQGQRYLLVVNDQNVVEYRPVTVGTLNAGLRGITAGLAPTDRVIVNGIQRVRPGLTVKPIEAPMPVGPDTARDRPAASAPAASPATPPKVR
jgi:multidrug efflux pump subunit AcrA (membrane-fusion protein)